MFDFIWNIFDSIPTEVFGLPFWAFIGLIVGTLLASYEGLRTKYRIVKLKVGNESITFDKKYLISAVVVVLVVGLTIFSIVEIGLSEYIPNDIWGFIIGMVLGFCEGMTTVKTMNQRIDLLLKKASAKAGADAIAQQKLADAVSFEDITEVPNSKSTVKFEEINFKNL